VRVHVSAVGLLRDGQVLTVRKRGTDRFMLVGGKPESDESPEQCARREALEEVGVRFDRLEPLGRRIAAAAHEPDLLVVGHCFLAKEWVGEPRPFAEIEELRWVPVSAHPADDLAPLLTERWLPVLRRLLGIVPDGLDRLRVRPAVEADLAALPEVERAADSVFREVGLDEVSDLPVPGPDAHRGALEAGRLVVAAVDGRVVGFARVEEADGRAHLEQLSVVPAWTGCGIGGRLAEEAVGAARDAGHSAMTLRTYREVSWNAPFFARLGWAPLGEAEWGPDLRSLVAAERAEGLDPTTRVAMVRAL
jgi:8-oxo-dGTP pyrophosphatase MutT (NUDIX family)/GNAT superfamily N-acetyltransferase